VRQQSASVPFFCLGRLGGSVRPAHLAGGEPFYTLEAPWQRRISWNMQYGGGTRDRKVTAGQLAGSELVGCSIVSQGCQLLRGWRMTLCCASAANSPACCKGQLDKVSARRGWAHANFLTRASPSPAISPLNLPPPIAMPLIHESYESLPCTC
jgi:hypothetical protein